MVTPTVRLVAAVLLADSVSILVPAVLIGLKDAVTPLGKPGGEKMTLLLLKPFDGVIVIVLEPLEPWVMLRLLGDAARLKFGTGTAFTVRLNDAV